MFGNPYSSGGVALPLAVVAALGLGTCSIAALPHCDRDEYQVRVTHLERVVDDGDSTYLVFTQRADNGDERVFRNSDSLWECIFGRCKFDSSDFHARLSQVEDTGQVCTVQTYGWRFPLLSWYENIVGGDCEPSQE